MSHEGSAADVYKGLRLIERHHSLIDLWSLLHAHANSWGRLTGESAYQNRDQYDKTDLADLSKLQQIDAKNWAALCDGCGTTVYGAVALSWCKGAELSQVWDAWEESQFPLKPDPEHARPARFINPALLPPQNSLKEIALITKGAMLPFCAMIVNAPDDLEFDLSDDLLRTAHPQLASFFYARMLRKADRTAQENELLKIWADIIKDTEFTTNELA